MSTTHQWLVYRTHRVLYDHKETPCDLPKKLYIRLNGWSVYIIFVGDHRVFVWFIIRRHDYITSFSLTKISSSALK